MTLKKANGDVNWAVVGPGILTALLAITGTGGAVGGQVAANTQMAELRVKVEALSSAGADREARLRRIETDLSRIASGVEMLLEEYKAERRRAQP